MRDIDRLAVSIATAPRTPRQLRVTASIAMVFLAATLLVWPDAAAGGINSPSFIAVYQTTIIVSYLLTAYLMLDQFVETRVVSLLWIGGGCLYTTLVLVLQYISFQGFLLPGQSPGTGPATTSWLWTFWHLAPPVYALGFAATERRGIGRMAVPGHVSLLLLAVCALVLVLAAVTALIVADSAGLLPAIAKGDDYLMLTVSGVGPATEVFTVLAIGVLWRATRLRTGLQLWLALSLFCLVLDDAITQAGGSRGSIGWTFGRFEALLSATMLLVAFLHRIRMLHRQATSALDDLEGAYADLRSAHAQLTEQAASLLRQGVELEASRAAAERASAAKSRFLASMSHEMRTPLTAIIGFCDLLALNDIPEGDRRAFFRLQREAADRLLNQIGGVLDLGKIEAGRLEIEAIPLTLQELVDSSFGIVGLAAGSKGLILASDIHPALPAAVIGDATRLRQVLLNFLSNAVKFTPAGSIHVIMEPAGCASPGHAHLRCTVADTGIGIAAEGLPHLFQDFSQIDASITRRFGGTGLGLAVSRQLIELMGGCCGVESVPGTGSRFWFEVTLPVAMMPLTASGLTGEPETAPIPVRLYGQAVRVLVVDDVYANRALLQQVLLRQGYEVTMADSGAGAVEAVRRGGFDVVLMDLQMPGMDGLAATAAIRASKTAGWNVPIVAITASNSPQEIARCLASGMQDCLTKPFDFGRLREVMRKVVPVGGMINLSLERNKLAAVR